MNLRSGSYGIPTILVLPKCASTNLSEMTETRNKIKYSVNKHEVMTWQDGLVLSEDVKRKCPGTEMLKNKGR